MGDSWQIFGTPQETQEAQLDLSARSVQIHFLHFALRVLLQQFLQDAHFPGLLLSLDLVDFFYLGLFGLIRSRCDLLKNNSTVLPFSLRIVHSHSVSWLQWFKWSNTSSIMVVFCICFSFFLNFSKFLAYALAALSPCLGRLHLVLLPRMSSGGVYPLSSWVLLHVSKPICSSPGFLRIFFRVFLLIHWQCLSVTELAIHRANNV